MKVHYRGRTGGSNAPNANSRLQIARLSYLHGDGGARYALRSCEGVFGCRNYRTHCDNSILEITEIGSARELKIYTCYEYGNKINCCVQN